MNNFKLEIKRLNYLYDNLINGLIALFGISIIIFFTFKGLVDITNLSIWFTLNILLILSRTILWINYKKTKITYRNFSKFYWLFTIFATLTALLWGMSVFFILPDEIEYKMILLLLIAGLISGSAISLASRIEIFYIYLTLAMVPFSYMFFQEDMDSSLIFSISILLYTFILFIMSKKMSTGVINNILTASQNENLIIQLEEKVKETNNANKAKSEFLSVMSHEIRTPLNAIMGFVQILKKQEQDKKKYKYLDTIDKSSKVLTNVINDILDVTKIESGKLTLENIEFQTTEEFNSLFLLFEQTAKEKGNKLLNHISNDLPTSIKSDILRIKQIISNLLSNAIKFTPKDKNITLIIEFKKSTSSLYVEVVDEGIGISKENITHITKAFTQADTSTAREYGGTGLGLSIVTSLLKLFNSELKIRSDLNKGSSFSFEIKVDVVNNIQNNIESTKNTDELNFNGKKVLVAEDNKTNQMLLSIVLNEFDIDVTIANDGLQAQEIFKEKAFDLILMDINMPNQNGINSMLCIKEYEKSKLLSPTPVVALTANAISGDKEIYLDKGFDNYLAKPIDEQELNKILINYLS